jgi:hypothetical protein
MFLRNAIQSKKEIHGNRKFGSHHFCKLKKPNKNFLKLKKILSGFLLFSGGLFWRQLRFGGNWLHIIFRRNVFGGSSDLAGTGFFSGRNLINKGAHQKIIANTSTTIRKILVRKIIC